MKAVCVFAGSSATVPKAYLNDAYRLGQKLAAAHTAIVYGAGATGCMGSLADGALQHGGEVIGVIPQFMVDNGWCRPSLTEVHVTASMHERKALIHSLAEAIIALPGGIGTYEELTEAITWKQLGLHNKPIIIVNKDGFYNPFLQQIEMAVNTNFMGDKETTGRRADQLFCVVNSSDEIDLD